MAAERTAGIAGRQGQPQAEEQLLAGAAAQDLDPERVAVGVVDAKDLLAQRRPDAAVSPLRQAAQIVGRLAERLRLRSCS